LAKETKVTSSFNEQVHQEWAGTHVSH